jgi:hypothetical protein
MKTNELTGKALNWAVGKAEGLDYWLAPVNYCGQWEHGGPIIERERIAVGFDGFDIIDSALPIWGAFKYAGRFEGYGPTPLIAAMRVYVASKLGDEVNVPEGL